MKLTRNEIETALNKWNHAWDNHDLDGVMELFHDGVKFENWTGGIVRGKEALRKAWKSWFEDHGDFRFTEEETFIDEKEQKVLYRWLLEWPSIEKGKEGRPEKRRGVDVIALCLRRRQKVDLQSPINRRPFLRYFLDFSKNIKCLHCRLLRKPLFYMKYHQN